MSDTNQLVARNVRRYRQERGLSLGELARQAGLSKQTLSKIEQGGGNPTVETLALLGAALDMPARRLLTEWGSPVFVQREDEDVWVADEGRSERVLAEIYGSGYVRNHLLRLERGAVASGPGATEPPGTLHHVYVLSGRLQVGPLNDAVSLDAGDFIRFPGDVPYSYACLSDEATAHIVTTLPQLRQFRPTGNR